jgi:hypothetical protein
MNRAAQALALLVSTFLFLLVQQTSIQKAYQLRPSFTFCFDCSLMSWRRDYLRQDDGCEVFVVRE